MELIENAGADIQTVLGRDFAGQHLIDTAGRFIYHALDRGNDLDTLVKCRFLSNHVDGNIKYDQGRLAEECQYNEFGQCAKETTYEEDGSAEIWLYNENGDVDSVTCLAPDGSITLEETYAYEYAEDMSTLSCKAYRGDALVRQTEYLYDNDMNMLGSVETAWNEDGTFTVAEYDGFFDLIQEATFTPEEFAAQ